LCPLLPALIYLFRWSKTDPVVVVPKDSSILLLPSHTLTRNTSMMASKSGTKTKKEDDQSNVDLGDDLDMDSGSEIGDDASDAEGLMEEGGVEFGDTTEDYKGAQG